MLVVWKITKHFLFIIVAEPKAVAASGISLNFYAFVA